MNREREGREYRMSQERHRQGGGDNFAGQGNMDRNLGDDRSHDWERNDGYTDRGRGMDQDVGGRDDGYSRTMDRRDDRYGRDMNRRNEDSWRGGQREMDRYQDQGYDRGREFQGGRLGMSGGMDQDFRRDTRYGDRAGMGSLDDDRGYSRGNMGSRDTGSRDMGMSGNLRAYPDDRSMGVRSGESHRGKGPKGHQRSDERIREAVNDALEDDHHVDASNIEVQVQNGEVTLTGTVSDRRQKRAAEDCVEDLRGVRDVHNQLRVQRQDDQGNQRTGDGVTMVSTDDRQNSENRSNESGDSRKGSVSG